jgi:hypothetical protein
VRGVPELASRGQERSPTGRARPPRAAARAHASSTALQCAVSSPGPQAATDPEHARYRPARMPPCSSANRSCTFPWTRTRRRTSLARLSWTKGSSPEFAPPERLLLWPKQESAHGRFVKTSEPPATTDIDRPQIAVSAADRAGQGLGRGCPPPGPNPQESSGNQRYVRGASSREWPANRLVFALIGFKLKIEVSPVRVRVSPYLEHAANRSFGFCGAEPARLARA